MKKLIIVLLLIAIASPAYAGSRYDRKFKQLKEQYGVKMADFGARNESIDALYDRLTIHFKRLALTRQRAGAEPKVVPVPDTVVPVEKVTQKDGYVLKFNKEFKVDW